MSEQPVRILHIVHVLNRGGMESRIMDLYRHLDKTKYQYDFYVESGIKGAFEDEITQLGGRIYYSKTRKLKFGIPNFRTFNAFLNSHHEYSVVYAYNQWCGEYLKTALKNNVKYRIASARTSLQTHSLKNLIKNIVKLSANKYTTHKFAVSKISAVWLFGKKRLGEVNVWPNAIDCEKFKFCQSVRAEMRAALGLSDEFTVIHVGNIRPVKNHPFLFHVFSEVCKAKPNAKLLLVGGGDTSKLLQLAETLNIKDKIEYLGVRSDVQDILQAGDAFVFPSFYEGFPGAVLEAETSGLYCLVSDSVTDEVEVTDHIRRIPLTDGAEKWARVLLESAHDISRENAYQVVKSAGFDIIDLARRTENFYQSLGI